MRRDDTGRDTPQGEGRADGRAPRHRVRLLASSAGLIVVPLAALALAGTLPTGELAATEVTTVAPTTEQTVVVGREPVPAPQRVVVAKGVGVVAPPTTTTTAPPPTTEPPAPEPEPEVAPEPEPVDEPDPVAVPAPAPAPAPAPTPPPPPPPAPAGSVSANLDAIAQCESGGNPDAYNPAGYYGAFQFSLATWHGLGMSGDPRDYTYAEQKYVAIALYNQRGYSPWPHCARSLGLI